MNYEEISKELAKTAKFGIHKVMVKKFGQLVKSIAVRKIANGQGDVAIGEFFILPSRKRVVDFTPSLSRSSMYLYVKRPDGLFINWFGYLEVLTIITITQAFVQSLQVLLLHIELPLHTVDRYCSDYDCSRPVVGADKENVERSRFLHSKIFFRHFGHLLPTEGKW